MGALKEGNSFELILSIIISLAKKNVLNFSSVIIPAQGTGTLIELINAVAIWDYSNIETYDVPVCDCIDS